MRLFLGSVGSSEPGIPFWDRWDALRKSAMLDYKPLPLVCTGTSEYMGAQSNACHSSARYFRELRVYSRRPLGLANLGFRFGAFACVTLKWHA